ncbi:hypothetical protein [Sulfitobacter sp. M22]|uniref:hypothetical protein n=1 Tax=Sulfitobacter sp. M22 TaxID=2675332 RepID=UPI001F22CDDC|nr:hypothetical protein [Sulfitobacter sp. M22]MCF7728406.1 hypothetical protein [Sulfitobacter sp. M22]|tara:strand:- start:227 stop:385 length:159 start_codon:yes stop_codon:yes gene_type:complete
MRTIRFLSGVVAIALSGALGGISLSPAAAQQAISVPPADAQTRSIVAASCAN